MTLNPIDTLCAVFIGYHAVVGLVRGFVFQMLRLLTWIGGVALSRLYSDALAERMIDVHRGLDAGTARILAWAAILIGVLLLSAVILAISKKIISGLRLSGVDRLAGLAFGALKAAVIVVILAVGAYSVARAFDIEERILDYRAVRWSTVALERLDFALPAQLASDLEARIRQAREKAEPTRIPSLPPGVLSEK